MEIVCVILASIGVLIMAVGHIWLVIIAFKKSIPWGLATLFLGIWASLIFICLNWQMTKKQFFIYLIGFCFIPISVIPMMLLKPDKVVDRAKTEAIDTNPAAQTSADDKTQLKDNAEQEAQPVSP